MKNRLIVIISTVFLMACNTMRGYDYAVAVMNKGNKDIYEVEISSTKGFWDRPGILIPEADKTYAQPIKYPFLDKFTVKWTTSDKQKLSKTLDLHDKIPKNFRGRLVFKIDKDNKLTFGLEDFDRNPIGVK